MTDDLQLFIIWNRGRRLESEILSDIAEKFEILQIFEVKWSKKNFAMNLARFYGKNLRKGRKKIRESGTGAFLAVLIRDKSPQYADGKNFNMSSAKYFYRQKFGGGYLVHASDNFNEAFENLLMITGRNIAEFAEASPSSHRITLEADLIGTEGWQDAVSLKQILAMLPRTELNSSGKIWSVITADAEQACRILNARRCWFSRQLYTVKVNGQKQKIRISPFS